MICVNLIVHAFSRCVTNTRPEKKRGKGRERGEKTRLSHAIVAVSCRFPKINIIKGIVRLIKFTNKFYEYNHFIFVNIKLWKNSN